MHHRARTPSRDADLLALFVGASCVRDADLVDPRVQPSFATFAVISGSNPKRSSSIRDFLKDFAAEGLVADLHVGEVQVGHHVGEQRERSCSPPSARSRARGARRCRRSASRTPRRRGPPRSAAITRSRYSRGSYSRSASCTTHDLAAWRAAKPERRAAPLPRFASCSTSCELDRATRSTRAGASRVPSLEASSTTITSLLATSEASTDSTRVRSVLASLKQGMTIETLGMPDSVSTAPHPAMSG